jgi:hypothetical protein
MQGGKQFRQAAHSMANPSCSRRFRMFAQGGIADGSPPYSPYWEAHGKGMARSERENCAFLGSVSRRVARHAPCSVLVVRNRTR